MLSTSANRQPAAPAYLRAPGDSQYKAFVVDPGRMRAYDEREWRDALVRIEYVEIELESTLGARYSFGVGDVLWLMGLPLRGLHNSSGEPAILVVVSRKSIVQ